jgi:HEAT repeat protein
LNVIDLIGTIGAKNPEEAREIAKSLALALSNSSLGGPSRLRLVQALANYGPDASDALPAVLSTVSDPSWETRRAVAFSLGRLAFATDPKKGPSANALKALSGNLLKDDSVAVRLESVQSLVMLGPPGFRDPTEYAKVIKPYLDNVLARQKAEKDKAVLIWLQVLVMRYDGTQLNDANVGKLADYLQQTEPSVRYHALSALAMLGDKAQPVVPRIAVGLGYQEPEMVLATIGTLASLGEIARAALPELERLKANTKEEALKRAATEAVEIISGRKKPDPNAPPPAPPPAPGQPPKM